MGRTPSDGWSPARLGREVRAVRVNRGLSISELARRSDVSQSFLSQFESGQTDISVGRLLRLAQALDIDAADLIARRVTPAERLVRADEQVELPTPSQGLRLHLLAASLDHTRTNAVGSLEPGSAAEPAYSSPGSESLVYVLKGVVRVELTGDRAFSLRGGDSISYRSEEFRSMANPGSRQSAFIWIQASSRA
jgi:transcriptional regulator with XRE-family HTH domain